MSDVRTRDGEHALGKPWVGNQIGKGKPMPGTVNSARALEPRKLKSQPNRANAFVATWAPSPAG